MRLLRDLSPSAVVAGFVVAGGAPAATYPTATFSDPGGDAATGPDITGVTVSADVVAPGDAMAYMPGMSGMAAGDRPAGCDWMPASLDAASPNLCAEHCRYGQQSDKAVAQGLDHHRVPHWLC